MAQSTEAIKAYWQPGCTSCLRMKEFLTKHGVPFVSVNVLEDRQGLAELAELGIRTVPIVRRGTTWANGQVLRDVARVAGIAWGGTPMLPAPELVSRLIEIQTTAQRLFAQIPDEALSRLLPHRPRSYVQLGYHIFNIADAFLELEVEGLPLEEAACRRRRWTPRRRSSPMEPMCSPDSSRGGTAPAMRPTSPARRASIMAT